MMPNTITSTADRARFLTLCMLAGVCLISLPVRAQSAAPGQAIYSANCASCHGVEGDGQGPAAALLYPKPRDFVTGIYRFKSTPGDQRPTMADVERAIREGIDRTAMPGFAGVLTEEQIAETAAYVLSLNPDQPASDAAPIEAPKQPATTPRLIEQGKRLYAAAGCIQCHGQAGDGRGPAAGALRDRTGWSLPAADFTQGLYKSGRSDADIYRTLMVGVGGTPMPGFAGALEPLEVEGLEPDVDRGWALVAYLRSLAEAPSTGRASGAVIDAAAANGEIGNPLAPRWRARSATRVTLRPLWQRREAPEWLDVRAAVADGALLLHLSWPDTTADVGAGDVAGFDDAAAVMFSLGKTPPPIPMGGHPSPQPADPSVNLWHWKAGRQLQMQAAVASALIGDDYPTVSKKENGRTKQVHDPLYLGAQAARNVHAQQALVGRAALESNAAGFGTLTLQPPDDQAVRSQAVWSEGRWHLVLRRDLSGAGEADVDLLAAHRLPLSFAVWDGKAGDRNGTKAISGWHWLEIDAGEAGVTKTSGKQP